MTKPSPDRYGSTAQFFHWCTAILVLIAFILGPGGPEARVYSAAHAFDRPLHETLGLSVFVLTLIRLLWRAVSAHPEPPPASRLMTLAASAVQWLLYCLLLALPLSAVAGAWLQGHPLTLVAGIQVQPLLGTAHSTGTVIASIHGLLGDAIMWLAGLHALAALMHHFVLKDNVLITMLPRWVPLGRGKNKP